MLNSISVGWFEKVDVLYSADPIPAKSANRLEVASKKVLTPVKSIRQSNYFFISLTVFAEKRNWKSTIFFFSNFRQVLQRRRLFPVLQRVCRAWQPDHGIRETSTLISIPRFIHELKKIHGKTKKLAGVIQSEIYSQLLSIFPILHFFQLHGFLVKTSTSGCSAKTYSTSSFAGWSSFQSVHCLSQNTQFPIKIVRIFQ